MTHQQEVMVLRLSSQIFEDGLLPVTLHMVPVLDHTVADRVMHAVAWGLRVRQRLIANEEVEVFYSTFRC